jgi:hypothetical protein
LEEGVFAGKSLVAEQIRKKQNKKLEEDFEKQFINPPKPW